MRVDFLEFARLARARLVQLCLVVRETSAERAWINGNSLLEPRASSWGHFSWVSETDGLHLVYFVVELTQPTASYCHDYYYDFLFLTYWCCDYINRYFCYPSSYCYWYYFYYLFFLFILVSTSRSRIYTSSQVWAPSPGTMKCISAQGLWQPVRPPVSPFVSHCNQHDYRGLNSYLFHCWGSLS